MWPFDCAKLIRAQDRLEPRAVHEGDPAQIDHDPPTLSVVEGGKLLLKLRHCVEIELSRKQHRDASSIDDERDPEPARCAESQRISDDWRAVPGPRESQVLHQRSPLLKR